MPAVYRSETGDISVQEVFLWALVESDDGGNDIVGVSWRSLCDDDPGFVGYARSYEHALQRAKEEIFSLPWLWSASHVR